MAEAASRGLGLHSMLLELGADVSLVVLTDSSAAKSFASTRGLGRTRHLEVKDLWLQALVRDGRVSFAPHIFEWFLRPPGPPQTPEIDDFRPAQNSMY